MWQLFKHIHSCLYFVLHCRPEQAIAWMTAALALLEFAPEEYDATHRPMMETNINKKTQEVKNGSTAPGGLRPRAPLTPLATAAGNAGSAQPAAAAAMLTLPPPAPRQRTSGAAAGAVLGIVGPAGGSAGTAQGLTLPPMSLRIKK